MRGSAATFTVAQPTPLDAAATAIGFAITVLSAGTHRLVAVARDDAVAR